MAGTGFRGRFVIGLGASLAASTAALAFRRRDALRAARASLRTSSAPGARWYEAIFDRILGGFYDVVAADVVATLADLGRARGTGASMTVRILEIGPGPGSLALRLAGRIPGLDYTGLDIDPAMVARARSRALAAGLDIDVRFAVGDVAALPFADETFDLVLSTFSVHHWAAPAEGFAEIRRVLRPGGRAVIHDLPDAWGRLETHAQPLAATAAGAFPGALATPVRWPGRVPLGRRLEVARPLG